MSKKHIVAIVGRPNVGKSTLFNRLTHSRTAIVDDVSGVTRDRIYGIADWNGQEFTIVDTGGYVARSEDIFESAIRKQVEAAIQEADLLLFMVDVRTGITDLDEEFAQMLRKAQKPVIVVSNKVDNATFVADSQEFHNFGLGDVMTVSAINGSGTGDLLDVVIEKFPKAAETEDNEDGTPRIPSFAILGRPNVGKSTFVNALVGEERNIVSDIPGTTRDSVDSYYKKFNKEFRIIDTAGLRKKGKVHENLEFYSTVRSIRSLEEADVCIIMIDAHEGIQAQDINIIQLAIRRNKGVVLLINKWDNVEKDTKTHLDYEQHIHSKLSLPDVPVIFTSALKKTRIFKAIEKAIEVYENKNQHIPTAELNKIMLKVIEQYHPPAVRGHFIKIKYVTQVEAEAPSFVFFCNFPKYIRDPYKRFLENKLREHFTFHGLPINIYFKKK